MSAEGLSQPPFLPMSRAEMTALGWKELDVLLISGDAYVDHPSFGTALLGRWLVSHGFRVGVVAQPRWADQDEAMADLTVMGRPRLLVGVTAGAIDSMLSHYTAFRKKRSDDAYTPGGKAGSRPNRAVLVYTTLARRAFSGLPVLIGGIEASLRRVSHYDFWSDSLRRSILLDSKADLLLYGMGERSLLAAANLSASLLDASSQNHTHLAHAPGASAPEPPGLVASPLPQHRDFSRLFAQAAIGIPGTVSAISAGTIQEYLEQGCCELPSHEAILQHPEELIRATRELEKLAHQGKRAAVQVSGERAVFIAPPSKALDTADLDALYALPFTRLAHPRYREAIPAWEMIRTSITSHRGCAGGCAFCSLAQHQGRRIASRSRKSILDEAQTIAAGPSIKGKPPAWAGSISDVGGPSANMWRAECQGPADCARPSCLWPSPCRFFVSRQKDSVSLLRDVAGTPGVRHVRVASGVRFDLALADPEALQAYTMDFTGGQLKVAPEHCAPAVLDLMRKPSLEVFERFLDAFADLSRRAGKEQYVIPYLMSAYPGCTEAHMRQLGDWLQRRNWSPRQVQCFIPTPGTLATAMYYAGRDGDGNDIPVARSDAERLRQHHILLGQGKDAGRAPGGRFPQRDGAAFSKRAAPSGQPRRSKSRPPRPGREEDEKIGSAPGKTATRKKMEPAPVSKGPHRKGTSPTNGEGGKRQRKNRRPT